MFREEFRFLGLGAEESTYERSPYVILPVPYDGTTSYHAGTRDAPRAIIGASLQVELYDGEIGFTAAERAPIHTLSELEPVFSGPRGMIDRVRDAARRIIDDGKIPLMLGGEHSVTSGPLEAFVQSGRFPGLSILQIDAHADLRAEYEGTPWSHASVMRRAFDLGLSFVQVGIRAISAEEAEFMREEKLSDRFFAWNLQKNGFHPEQILAELGDPVYVTIDVDGFDPAVFPGTGTPEPGGLGWYPVLDLLKQVAARRRIVGVDLVEVIPTPPMHACEFAAARLLYKLVGYMEAGR